VRNADELARIVVDAAFHIHKDIGPGLLESAYETLLAEKLLRLGLRIERQMPIDIVHDGIVVPAAFRIDLFVENTLVVEIKSVERPAPVHAKQVLTYIRLMRLSLGLLINFGTATFREGVQRVANNHSDLASLRLGVNQ
jgi:GxxExxY protein